MTKDIVLVRGGFAGIGVANALEKALMKENDQEHQLILIEKETHFYHAVAGPCLAVADWNHKVMIPYTNLFQTKKNKVIQASAVRLLEDKIVLDQQVKNTLQVNNDGLDHVFVIEDAADMSETKMAYRAHEHVPVVVDNIVQMAIYHKQPTTVYKKGMDAMFISFGKKQGVGVLPFFRCMHLGSWAVSSMKRKTLFTQNSRKTLNLKKPIN